MAIARPTLLLLAALAAGCASDPPDGVEVDPAPIEDTVASDTAASDPAAPDSALFARAFASVCRGTSGQPAAAAYHAEPGVHPFLTLTSADGIEYQSTSAGTFPDGWRVSWPNLAQAELVVCAHRIVATPAQVCDGYDNDAGAEWSVQLHDTVYDYAVRVAQSGELLGATKFEVPAGDCPMVSIHRERGPQPQPSYGTPSAGAIELFVRPFVRGD
ncbi:hypothetical protein [Rubrivirga sp. IMCC43871]|uniref:hypothetical protein n=1 Tax=Rubrivirga sp. IMCC43871 TaxID=3391575 RepID=UPI00398FD81B